MCKVSNKANEFERMKDIIKYSVERYTASMNMPEYIDGYIDVEIFLGNCKRCKNFGKIWSCPPYDFDVMEYWRKFSKIEFVASKIIFGKEYGGQEFSKEELDEILKNSLFAEKRKLSDELLEREEEIEGSVSLCAGSCSICGEVCPRVAGGACLHPEKMRYSIESLGGNVGLTISKLMGLELEWMEENKLPHYFILVSGILIP